MNTIAIILCQCALALAITLTVVAVWSPPLRRVLQAICGTDDRANFWLTYSNIMLVASPLTLTLFCTNPNGVDPVFAIIKQGLVPTMIGMVLALAAIGLQIAKYLPRASSPERRAHQEPEPHVGAVDRASAGTW